MINRYILVVYRHATMSIRYFTFFLRNLVFCQADDSSFRSCRLGCLHNIAHLTDCNLELEACAWVFDLITDQENRCAVLTHQLWLTRIAFRDSLGVSGLSCDLGDFTHIVGPAIVAGQVKAHHAYYLIVTHQGKLAGLWLVGAEACWLETRVHLEGALAFGKFDLIRARVCLDGHRVN